MPRLTHPAPREIIASTIAELGLPFAFAEQPRDTFLAHVGHQSLRISSSSAAIVLTTGRADGSIEIATLADMGSAPAEIRAAVLALHIAPEGYVALPLHEVTAAGLCRHCDDLPGPFANYAEYVEHFWAYEYEGDRGHAPGSRAVFDYVAHSCDRYR